MSQMSVREPLPEIIAPDSTRPLPRILRHRAPSEARPGKKVTFNTRLRDDAPNKKSNKKKKKVRLKVPESPAAPSEVLRDPFINNWLVDAPRDILRERSVMDDMTSTLQEQLVAFHSEVAQISDAEYELARNAAEELISVITHKLKKMKLSNGLKVLPPVFAGSTFDHSHSMRIVDTDILLCFELHAKARVETLQAGYQIIKLPHYKEKEGRQDPWRFGRSADGQYLSCCVVSKVFHGIVEKSLQGRANMALHPYTVREGISPIVVTVDDRHVVQLIPATWDPHLEGFLVTRPYVYDENPSSDMMWRYCFTQDEHLMFRAMNNADRGKRLKVYQVMRALLVLEHTLEGLTTYQLKTVIFHTFDADIDGTPRWQRGDLESCFMNVLKELKYCFLRRNLPHFFVRGFNLLENLPDPTWSTLKSRIAYLASDRRECARVLRKRSRYDYEARPHSSRVTSVTSAQTI